MALSDIITQLQSTDADFNDVADGFSLFGAATSWTPTFSGSGSMTFTSVTSTTKYWLFDKLFIAYVFMIGTTGGTASNELRMTLPITCSNTNFRGGAAVSDAAFLPGTWYTNSTTEISFRKFDGSNFALAASKSAGTILILEVA